MTWRLDRVLEYLRRAAGVDDFIVVERIGTRRQRGPGGDARQVDDSRVDATIFRNLLGGRGVAHVHIGPEGRDIGARLSAAIERASLALGPAWTAPPPAAPARVQVADPAIADLDGALDSLMAEVAVDPGSDRRVVAVERWQCAVHTRAGLVHSFPSTLVSARAQLGAGRLDAEPIVACARRLSDVNWLEIYRRAERRQRLRAQARPLTPGRYDLILAGDSLISARLALAAPERPTQLTHTPLALDRRADPICRFGWFAPLLAQADGELIRLGLTRYRPGQSISSDDDARALAATEDRYQLLTLGIDGTIPYGLRSRPFDDLGEPTRQHSLIANGIATGRLRTLRDAALESVLPTGGIGNLVIPAGRTPPTVLRARGPTGRPVLQIITLANLDPDPLSGDLTAQLDLSLLHDGTPVTGGIVRGNLFTWLLRAQYASQLADHGWYRGPEAIRFDDVWLA